MIKLNYQTYNFAHGECGIKFFDWEEFSFILGFLSNINHYRNFGQTGIMDNSISVYTENNHRSGANGPEGRIFYSGQPSQISLLSALDRAKTRGTSSETFRINCSEYINCLIHDFNFTTNDNQAYTQYHYPGDVENIKRILFETISQNPNVEITSCDMKFNEGFSL